MTTLVKVNGREVDAASAVRYDIAHNGRVLKTAVENALVREYADQHGISNSDQELQLAANELRYQLGLESSAKLKQWLRDNHLTLHWLQDYVDGLLLRNKMRQAISDEDVEVYFAEHQLEFDAVDLYSIRLDNEETAKELYSQITEDGENFHLLAMEHSLDENTRFRGGYVGTLGRAQLSGEMEAAVFKAEAGEVVGPVKTDRGYNLLKVAAVHRATLASLRDEVRSRLFQEMLDRLAREAEITYPLLDGDAAGRGAS